MMFIVALYLPWCRYLSAQVGVEPQLCADNLKCVSRDPDLLLDAARYTTGNVRLVCQEPAPSKRVLLCTSSGLSGLMYGIWVGIWTRPFVAGRPLWLLEFAWLFLV